MILSAPHADTLRFIPCGHSWVALHPQPKGIIQFIGGALFGTLPTISYHHFLRSLFEAGYTVVALPFRFILNHWSMALNLLDEHYAVRVAMVELAIAQGYDPHIYLEASNYIWIGHGVGCKYILLLELLSTPPFLLAESFAMLERKGKLLCSQQQQIERGLEIISRRLRLFERQINQLVGVSIDFGQPSIMHEVSLLLAPAMGDMNAAIPVTSLHWLLSQFRGGYPSVDYTHQLIEHSQLFHLTGLIQFARDRIAAGTCQRLMQEQPHLRRRLLQGDHLEPVGMRFGSLIIDLNPFDKFIQPLTQRNLESQTLALLKRLQTPAPKVACPMTTRKPHSLAA
ncbi:MAG: DUF1350 family protein [Cyanobacteria bacterium P01_D01_bin.156]